MALRGMALALLMAAAAAPAAAQIAPPTAGAPPGTPETRYCLKIQIVTGSVLQKIMCLTRAEWEDEWVDLDKEWAREGVGIREGKG